MSLLYPRPYRAARVEVVWRTWRDMHPRPMAGFDVLRVPPPPWWQRFLYARRGYVSINFWFGALSVWWRREVAA